MIEKNIIKIAVLDLYAGAPNEGMRCIRELLNQFTESTSVGVIWDEFEVRNKQQVPGLEYDIYISSGGPGSPLDSEGTEWEKKYFNWLYQVEKWNHDPTKLSKKYIFLICHSFQLVCRHHKIADVTKRNQRHLEYSRFTCSTMEKQNLFLPG